MERKEFKQTVKENFLAIEKKYREIKKIATMSSNDPNYDMDKVCKAQRTLMDPCYSKITTYNMWKYNCAWYIVKHNLDLPENQEKLFEYISQTFRHCDRYIGNPDFICNSVNDCSYILEDINILSSK